MLKRDVNVGLFLLIFIAAPLCYGSVRLGIGTAYKPGPGFLPFFTGLILALMSVVLIVVSMNNAGIHEKKTFFIGWGAVLITAALILTGIFIEKVGFFTCAFLMSTIVLRINGVKNWPLVILFSFSTCVVFYLFFNLFLSVRLPLGILQLDGK